MVAHYPDSWPAISAADEAMRSGQRDLILEEKARADPGVLREDKPWGAIIANSAYGRFNSSRADWWVDVLTFALDHRGTRPPAAAPPPPTAPPTFFRPTPKAPAGPAKGKGKGKDKGKGKAGKLPKRCWLCGSTDHLQQDCPLARVDPPPKEKDNAKKGPKKARKGDKKPPF